MCQSRTKTLTIVSATIALGTMLAACSEHYLDRRDTMALSSGDAVAANKVAQMIDPWPPRVIKPVGIGTSSANYQQGGSSAIVGGGGGGSGQTQ